MSRNIRTKRGDRMRREHEKVVQEHERSTRSWDYTGDPSLDVDSERIKSLLGEIQEIREQGPTGVANRNGLKIRIIH